MASNEQSRTRRRRRRRRHHDIMGSARASVEHLPSFLVYVNQQLNGSLLTNECLYRHDVKRFWPPFSATCTIRLPNGEDARVPPSSVCFALIRTFSVSGARPKAQVQNREMIQLGERALEAIRVGFDPRHDLIKVSLDKSRSHDLMCDKDGVSVSCDRPCFQGHVSCGDIRVNEPLSTSIVATFQIHNNSSVPVQLEKCYLLFEHHGFKIPVDQAIKFPCRLKPSMKADVKVAVSVDHIGTWRDWLVWEFSVSTEEPCRPHSVPITKRIVRFLNIHFKDSVTSDPSMQASAPFKARPVKHLKPSQDDVIDGRKPERPKKDEIEILDPLKEYGHNMITKKLGRGLWIPPYTRTGHDTRMPLNREQISILKEPLSKVNYDEKMLLLLLLEHRQEEVDIHNYDMVDAEMTLANTYLALTVVGLAENRPSLLRNDRLIATKKGEKDRYRGYVHTVEQSDVLLRFSKSFHDRFLKKQKCDIEFCINPNPWWARNRAVLLSQPLLEDFLFPTERCLADNEALVISRFNEQKIEHNPEQKEAISHIVAGSSGRAPYLIFGPPGTGKTTTLVEAIKQVKKAHAGCRILACTPSNSAADLITRRLLEHIDKRDIIRLNALSRSVKSVGDKVEGVSKVERDPTHGNQFFFPSLDVIKKYKIVICTLTSSGRLASANLGRDHFTHVFIDECGHAVEAECMIPLGSFVRPGVTQVVLAGDPHQLGPIVRSTHAARYSLHISLLERLMTTCELYQRRSESSQAGSKPYIVKAVTKLLQNYRSHPAIIKVPNKCFYNNELQVCADQGKREMLCNWEGLPDRGKKAKFPIIFHGVNGNDDREANSPSFFNPEESACVLKYVEQLRECRSPQISASDIGVISPYHKQVLKIRKVLQGKHYDSVKVGSVEEFQGQERTVIIISTVRSQSVFLEMDKKFNLGFLRNPKRFNVAITRAIALLIVVGNPYILAQDPNWNDFLDFCIENGGYTGYPYRPNDLEVARKKIEGFHLSAAAAADHSTEGDLREDPGWRREE